MKKLILLFMTCLVFMACSDKDSYQINSNTHIISLADWKLEGAINGTGSHFYYDLDDADLTKSFLDKGALNVYMIYTHDKQDIQVPLPFTRTEVLGNGDYAYDVTYDYDFSRGTIYFYMFYSDDRTERGAELTRFRVVKQWKN